MSKEIEWTDEGEKYARSIAPNTPEWKQQRAVMHRIREQHGFPTWEIKKALTNAQGDEAKAVEALMQCKLTE